MFLLWSSCIRVKGIWISRFGFICAAFPFAAWVLRVWFQKDVDIVLLTVCYVLTIGCTVFHAASVVTFLSGLCVGFVNEISLNE
jgi:hypothetical protein